MSYPDAPLTISSEIEAVVTAYRTRLREQPESVQRVVRRSRSHDLVVIINTSPAFVGQARSSLIMAWLSLGLVLPYNAGPFLCTQNISLSQSVSRRSLPRRKKESITHPN